MQVSQGNQGIGGAGEALQESVAFYETGLLVSLLYEVILCFYVLIQSGL